MDFLREVNEEWGATHGIALLPFLLWIADGLLIVVAHRLGQQMMGITAICIFVIAGAVLATSSKRSAYTTLIWSIIFGLFAMPVLGVF